jgi:hypothetical protein
MAVINPESLRESYQAVAAAVAEVDRALIQAGDLPATLLAEQTLLAARLCQRLRAAAEDIKAKSAPLFAQRGAGQADGAKKRPKG